MHAACMDSMPATTAVTAQGEWFSAVRGYFTNTYPHGPPARRPHVLLLPLSLTPPPATPSPHPHPTPTGSTPTPTNAPPPRPHPQGELPRLASSVLAQALDVSLAAAGRLPDQPPPPPPQQQQRRQAASNVLAAYCATALREALGRPRQQDRPYLDLAFAVLVAVCRQPQHERLLAHCKDLLDASLPLFQPQPQQGVAAAGCGPGHGGGGSQCSGSGRGGGDGYHQDGEDGAAGRLAAYVVSEELQYKLAASQLLYSGSDNPSTSSHRAGQGAGTADDGHEEHEHDAEPGGLGASTGGGSSGSGSNTVLLELRCAAVLAPSWAGLVTALADGGPAGLMAAVNPAAAADGGWRRGGGAHAHATAISRALRSRHECLLDVSPELLCLVAAGSGDVLDALVGALVGLATRPPGQGSSVAAGHGGGGAACGGGGSGGAPPAPAERCFARLHACLAALRVCDLGEAMQQRLLCSSPPCPMG